MERVFNVSLVGVGGQGILLISDVLAQAAARAGHDVKKSEIHGMAQRGGSVISQVRFGPRVYSPIIADGSSDVLVAFDRLEALRWRHLMAPDGQALINRHDVIPVSVTSGQQAAVEDLDGLVTRLYPEAVMVPATALAQGLGQVRATNMVMAGALSHWTPFPPAVWLEALRARLPAKLVALNERAFAAGREAAAALGVHRATA
ncbi:MAG: indolepyruvate oxidoreductase subunit beta [Lentisphaerae bacterium]|nr:indolepyruvate oxidoreductase subunit beta [Lentisphaerota bacterium]